ncbi:MAG: tRNA (adenosine(37)-N6)-dimethylallyltransferase MiaA, partial [Candidatus Sericytochromatia bacterium]
IPEVAPRLELRQNLLTAETEQGEGHLHQRLSQLDPAAAARLHPNDLRRVVRALEVIEATGKPISAQQSREAELRYPCLYLGLSMPRPRLEERIAQRIVEMVQTGLIDEVKGLRERYGADLPLLQTLNYREIGDYLDGKCDLPAAINAMLIHTRQYAKRQMTWFRKDPGIHWLELGPSDLSAHAPWLHKQGLKFGTVLSPELTGRH